MLNSAVPASPDGFLMNRDEAARVMTDTMRVLTSAPPSPRFELGHDGGRMKAYLLVTGSLFGLVGVAHLLRLFLEPGHTISSDPWFFGGNMALFVVGGGVAAWAFRLLRELRTPAA
jgi:hypothetical protein